MPPNRSKASAAVDPHSSAAMPTRTSTFRGVSPLPKDSGQTPGLPHAPKSFARPGLNEMLEREDGLLPRKDLNNQLLCILTLAQRGNLIPRGFAAPLTRTAAFL